MPNGSTVQAGTNRPVASAELERLVDMVQDGFRRDKSVPAYLIQALIAAARAALTASAQPPVLRDIPEWSPTPDQCWRPKKRDASGARISAIDVFHAFYEPIPYRQRPYAHQLRQHPETKHLYDSLCVLVSRNKARGRTPASIGDLFPVAPEARGGMYAAQDRRTADE